MLVEQDSGREREAGASAPARPRSRAVLTLLALAAVGVWVLRHDYWNWDTPYPLLFGFLPVGLWWQGLVSILAAVLMWMMVRFAWPGEVEEEAIAAERARARQDEGVRG
jgi:hypothetical protein